MFLVVVWDPLEHCGVVEVVIGSYRTRVAIIGHGRYLHYYESLGGKILHACT